MIRKHNLYDANYDFHNDDFEENCVAVISDSDSPREVEPVNVHIQFGNTKKSISGFGERLHCYK